MSLSLELCLTLLQQMDLCQNIWISLKIVFLIFKQIQMSNETKMACQLKLSVFLSVYHIYLSTVSIFLCEV